MTNDIFIQTTNGIHKFNSNDKILIHEHVFNRFPFWNQKLVEDHVLRELYELHKRGITIICDLTAYTKPYNYYGIIEHSPIKIVSCIGFYTLRYVAAQFKNQDVNSIINTLKKNIEIGVGTKRIKPGILKIAAQSHDLNAIEKKLFYVISQISKEYNLPIALHAPKGALNHVRNLLVAGAKPEKIFVAHIESNISKENEYDSRLREAYDILKLGSYIQLSDFGNSVNSVKCQAAINFAKEIINNGYLHQLLISSDSCWRCKANSFTVKDYNRSVGKHYFYTTDFSLPMLSKEVESYDLKNILLYENPIKLFM